MTTQITKPSQDKINDEILSSLHDILQQNRQIIQKIDAQNARIDSLEYHITKKATTAGAVAGAIAGTATSGMFTIGMEIIKAKFGG